MKLYIFHIIFIFSFVLNQVSYADDFITIYPKSDTLFVGDEVTFSNNDLTSEISIFYSLDKGSSWNLITDNLTQDYKWTLPFSLSRLIKFKVEKRTTIPPKIIWENKYSHFGEVRSIDLSDDGKLALTLGRDNYIKIWDITNRNCIDSINIGSSNYCYSAKFFHNNDKIIYAIDDKSYLWDRVTRISSEFYSLGDFVRSIDVHPTENRFAVITNDNNLALFNDSLPLPAPNFLRLYSTTDYSNFYGVRYSRLGDKVGIATYQGKIIVTEGQISKSDDVYQVDSKLVFNLDFFDNDKKIIFGGTSNQLKILTLADDSIVSLDPIFSSQVRDVRFNKPKNDLIAVSLDSNLRQWKASTYLPYEIGNIKVPFAIMSLDLSLSGDTIALAGRNNIFHIWKNYFFEIDTQLFNFEYRQRVEVSLNSKKLEYKPKDNFTFELDVNSQFSDTLQKLGEWEFHSKLAVPIELLFLPNENELPLVNNNFIIDTSRMYDFSYSKLFEFKGKVLFANSPIESIDIIEADFLPEDNFYIILKKLDLSQNYFCSKEPYPSINILSKPEMIINQLKGSEKIEILLKIYQEDYYNLHIYNNLGEEILRYMNKKLKPGNYEEVLNTSDFSNGVYFLILNSQNSKISGKILKVE